MNFIFRGDELLVREADMALPDDACCEQLGIAPGQWQELWVGRAPEQRVAQLGRDAQPDTGDYAFRKLRSFFGVLDDTRMGLASKAFQIGEWARTHRYCGACATPTERVAHEHCMRCPACGLPSYPRVSPAMMVLIRRDDHILLARHATYARARHTALAGFVEAGESVEDAIHREVEEEVGLQVKNLRYFQSQSWPFPHSLMIAFTAEYAGGEVRVQESEIAEANWYGPGDALPPVPMAQSVAGRLVRANLPAGVVWDPVSDQAN
ncbi:NADH pyrophosphatase [plant metagenome]|uniref:NAD(+) diphosphatase n=2 Tax=root TaxID=1 RepID=A0A1C3K3H0_9BURK|nr:NAD(+) diphosphatase [Orrella dioscoreae]SBT25907.1 NADH pyrophosphatase [Orrella dioscoreae]SOE51846.1 NADH pyrophosphatase [Orrella dioscoreae]